MHEQYFKPWINLVLGRELTCILCWCWCRDDGEGIHDLLQAALHYHARQQRVWAPSVPEKLVPKFTLLASAARPFLCTALARRVPGVLLPPTYEIHCAVPCNSQVKLAASLMLPDSWAGVLAMDMRLSRHGLCHPGRRCPGQPLHKLTARASLQTAPACETYPYCGCFCVQSTRSYLYVEDVAEAFEVVLRKGTIGETYNIGTQKERTVMDVANAIAKHFKLPTDNIVHVRDRAFNDQR